MYYKLESGNETYDKLNAVWKKANECQRQAFELVKTLGFSKYCANPTYAAGGISAVYSPEKPVGYKQVGKSYQNIYYPQSANKQILHKINHLPVMTYEEYNEPIGFKSHYKGFCFYQSYGCFEGKDIFLIKLDDECNYKPTKDMVEITFTEYSQLKIDRKLT